MIIIIILMDDKSEAALQVLSYALLLGFLYMSTNFYLEYRFNEKARKTQIYVYSQQLMPMLKYEAITGKQGKMVENNAEYLYFFSATILFLVWSLLAGMLLREDRRYIGLGLTSLVIVIMAIYIIRNVNKASAYLRHIDILQIPIMKYAELQEQGLEYRERLVKENMNIDQIGEKINIDDDEVDYDKIAKKRDEILSTTKEWKHIEQVWSKRLRSFLLCGSGKAEIKINLTNEEVLQNEKDFLAKESYHTKVMMFHKIDNRVDHEMYNNLASKSYFIGLLLLFLANNQKELVSKIKTILNEMKILLKDTNFKDHVDRLDYELFMKMELDSEYDQFNKMYDEYSKIREEKRKNMSDREKEEEKKRLEREEKERELSGNDSIDIMLGDDGIPIAQVIRDPDTKSWDEFVKKGDEYLAQFAKHDPFEDEAFYGNTAISVTGDVSEFAIDRWRRPKDMLDAKGVKIANPKVIVDGFGCNDIGQGSLGDCWFLSALSVVAFTRPDLLTKLFHPKVIDYNPKGLHVIRFFKGGKNKITYIDDRFPCDNGGGSVFCETSSNSNGTELWPLMLEKAYAKIHKSYQAIDGGRPEQALVDLTNGTSEVISFSSKEFKQMKNDGSFWQTIFKACDEGHLLAASSNGTSDKVQSDLGIVQGHAYSVLDCQEIDKFQLVQLRNPWGSKEWTGDWSDKDTKHWTQQRVKTIAQRQKQKNRNPLEVDEDDGAFWISLDDFTTNYSSVSIVRIYEAPYWKKVSIRSGWRGISAGGCPNHPKTYKHNPQFKITVSRSTKAIINMQQRDKRGQGGDESFAIGWTMYSNNGEKISSDRPPNSDYKSGSYNYSRDFAVEIPEIKGKQESYTMVCATFDPAQETDFAIDIISKEEIFVEQF